MTSQLLIPVFISLLSAIPQIAVAQAREKQNVLIIVADDLGVDYVSAYREGANPAKTPNIDALAKRGVLFRNAWASPVCSPARACLMTGRYSFRTGIGKWHLGDGSMGPNNAG